MQRSPATEDNTGLDSRAPAPLVTLRVVLLALAADDLAGGLAGGLAVAPVAGHEPPVAPKVGAHVLILDASGCVDLTEASCSVARNRAAVAGLAPVGDRECERELRVDAAVATHSNRRLRGGLRLGLVGVVA